jgi:hypothetical protein
MSPIPCLTETQISNMKILEVLDLRQAAGDEHWVQPLKNCFFDLQMKFFPLSKKLPKNPCKYLHQY